MTGIDGTTPLRCIRHDRHAVAALPDIELVERARDGSEEAYTVLYRRHVPYARATARRLLRSHNDIDDVVSTAFLWTFRAISSGGGPTRGAFGGYLVRAVRSAVAERRRLRVMRTEQSTSEPRVLDRPAAAVDGWIDDIDPQVRDALGRLPERWTTVLTAVDVDGRPVGVVGAELGLSPNSTTVLVKRARAGLRRALAEPA